MPHSPSFSQTYPAAPSESLLQDSISCLTSKYWSSPGITILALSFYPILSGEFVPMIPQTESLSYTFLLSSKRTSPFDVFLTSQRIMPKTEHLILVPLPVSTNSVNVTHSTLSCAQYLGGHPWYLISLNPNIQDNRSHLVPLKLCGESVSSSPSSLLSIHWLSPDDYNSLLIILPALTSAPFQFFLQIETRPI